VNFLKSEYEDKDKFQNPSTGDLVNLDSPHPIAGKFMFQNPSAGDLVNSGLFRVSSWPLVSEPFSGRSRERIRSFP
jgi:hypothetical protein